MVAVDALTVMPRCRSTANVSISSMRSLWLDDDEEEEGADDNADDEATGIVSPTVVEEEEDDFPPSFFLAGEVGPPCSPPVTAAATHAARCESRPKLPANSKMRELKLDLP